MVPPDPLTLIRPRAADKSISPAPPSRTISYSFICLIFGWLSPQPDNPSIVPLHVDATPAPAGSDDKSARARGCSTSVFEKQTFSNSAHEIEYTSRRRAQPNPTSLSPADRRDRSCVAEMSNSL